jgi:hypothetical protein
MKQSTTRQAQAETDGARNLLLTALRKLANEDHELFKILIGLFVPIKRKATDEALIQQFDAALNDEEFRKVAKLIIAECKKIWKGGNQA